MNYLNFVEVAVLLIFHTVLEMVEIQELINQTIGVLNFQPKNIKLFAIDIYI